MFLFFYNFILNLLSPFLILTLVFRIILGKENKSRYLERFGIASDIRVKKIKMIWFHACSVGEVKSISSLTNEFLKKNYSVLITTNTLLSANYVKKEFSDKIKHQFLPMDFNFTTKKFLNHWKPDIGIFVESEIWPNLINNCNIKNIPLMLLQASFSKKSLKKWSLFKSFFKDILSNFNVIIAQSKNDKKKLFDFANIKVHGTFNLKNSSPILEVKQKDVLKIKNKINNPFIITALSTHIGEEKIILDSFNEAANKLKNIFLILQPRHPRRAKKIKKLIESYGFSMKQRSKFEFPNKDTVVYLADTFGESGTLISMANLVILGGTLTPVGGHNIIEPAQMSKCIIVGKYHSKIKDTVDTFKNCKAIKLLEKNTELSKLIINIYNNRKELKYTAKKAFSVSKNFPKQEKNIINQIISLEKNENTKILVQKEFNY